MQNLIDLIRAGDRVTITNRFGQERTGRAVMPCIAGGWVLNMGGKHGTPGIANDANIVRVSKGRRRPSRFDNYGSTYTRFSSGAEVYTNKRGRCEDAPACGCCTC